MKKSYIKYIRLIVLLFLSVIAPLALLFLSTVESKSRYTIPVSTPRATPSPNVDNLLFLLLE